MAVSVILGARLLADSDDRVLVSVASGDIAAGTALADVDLDSTEVAVSDRVAATLIGPGSDLGDGLVFAQPVRAGELVPRSALSPATATGLVQVPISVDPDQVPPSVGPGGVVDVYVLERGARLGAAAEPALAAASVVEASAADSAMVSTGKRQLVVAVPDEDAQAFFAALGAADQPTVTVVRRQ